MTWSLKKNASQAERAKKRGRGEGETGVGTWKGIHLSCSLSIACVLLHTFFLDREPIVLYIGITLRGGYMEMCQLCHKWDATVCFKVPGSGLTICWRCNHLLGGGSPEYFSRPFFVYRLIDPRSGLPFYIGQATRVLGMRQRLRQHIHTAKKEQAAGKISSRAQRILEILNSSMEPAMEFVCLCSNREGAYAVEREEIARIGLENLTNISPGVHLKLKRRLRSNGRPYRDEGGAWILNCIVCGREFKTRADNRTKTCSKECFSELGRRFAAKRWKGMGHK